MKNVNITYKMIYGTEIINSSVTLEMMQYLAQDVVDGVENGIPLPHRVENALKAISELQGYIYHGIVHAEIVTPAHHWRVTWCDQEGVLHEREFTYLPDACAEAKELMCIFDGVSVEKI